MGNLLASVDDTTFEFPPEVTDRLEGRFPPAASLVGDHLVLDIPTYDGDPNTTHPDVLFIPEGFGPQGHRYWMSHTPYPMDPRENASVVSSPDGVTWDVPPGAPDPVVPYSEITPDGYYYNSDSVLFMLADGVTLALYYRLVDPGTAKRVTLARKTTTDGITWSPAQTIIDVIGYETTRAPILSPSLVREDNGTVTMYAAYPDPGGAITQEVQRWTSTDDGATFTYRDTCTLPTAPSHVWHLDVKRAGEQYWMLINRRQTWDLHLLSSKDGKTWTFRQAIHKTGTVWDEFGHYRSAMLIKPGNPYTIDIYAGGIDSSDPEKPVPIGNATPPGTAARWRILLMRNIPIASTGDRIDETATTVGDGAKALTARTTAIGAGAEASGTQAGATAIGHGTKAVDGAVGIGAGVDASGAKAVAIGPDAVGTYALTVAIGEKADPGGANSVAVGRSAIGTGAQSTMLGTLSTAAIWGTALGYLATAASTAVAIGAQTSAHSNSVALGRQTATSAASQVAFGARHLEIKKITSAPGFADDGLRLFAIDNGSGKTQLAARFPSGAVQVLATEP